MPWPKAPLAPLAAALLIPLAAALLIPLAAAPPTHPSTTPSGWQKQSFARSALSCSK